MMKGDGEKNFKSRPNEPEFELVGGCDGDITVHLFHPMIHTEHLHHRFPNFFLDRAK